MVFVWPFCGVRGFSKSLQELGSNALPAVLHAEVPNLGGTAEPTRVVEK